MFRSRCQSTLPGSTKFLLSHTIDTTTAMLSTVSRSYCSTSRPLYKKSFTEMTGRERWPERTDEQWWESDPRWQFHKDKIPGHVAPGAPRHRDFGMGVYAHEMRKDSRGKISPIGKYMVSPMKDPVTFITNCLLIGITAWTTANLSKGESYYERRKIVLRDRIRREFDLPEGWDDEIEEDDDFMSGDNVPIIQEMEEDVLEIESREMNKPLAKQSNVLMTALCGHQVRLTSLDPAEKVVAMQNPMTVEEEQELINMTEEDLLQEFTDFGKDEKGRKPAARVVASDMMGFPGVIGTKDNSFKQHNTPEEWHKKIYTILDDEEVVIKDITNEKKT